MEFKSNKYSIINNCGWIPQLFLLIILFYLFKKNIQLGLVASLIIILIYYKYDFELFTETKNLPIDKMIDSIDVNKLNYNTFDSHFDIIELDRKAVHITKAALKDKKLKKIIENKMIEIYGEIKNNDELKMYLKFMNLIREDSMPSFINECEEVLLNNKIKIILMTLPK
jgi:hypothetical protein